VTSKLLARCIKVIALHAPFDAKPPAEAAADSVFSFHMAKVEAAIGLKGPGEGRRVPIRRPRSEPIEMQGTTVPGAMATATAINFQPMDDGKAALRRISWRCPARGGAFASSLLLREARPTHHPGEP
jgi:hypothetical protein